VKRGEEIGMWQTTEKNEPANVTITPRVRRSSVTRARTNDSQSPCGVVRIPEQRR
jgi:hypothetical protein